MIRLRSLSRTIKRTILEPSYALDAGTKRLRGWLSYLFRNGESSWPESVTLFLTHLCNLRCKMCGQWGEQGSFKDMEAELLKHQLTINEITSFLDDISSFKPNMTLFGGEPLLHNDIAEVVNGIKKRGMHLLIITNGLLLEKYAEMIVDSGVDEISVSVDGPAYINDEVREKQGLTDAVKRGIKKIQDLKKEKEKKYPIINVVCVISNRTYNKLSEMTVTASELCADTLNIHHLIWIDKDINDAHQKHIYELLGHSSPDWNGFVLDNMKDIDTGMLIDEITKVKKTKSKVPVYFYPNFTDSEIKEYYSVSDFNPESFSRRCLNPWLISYIYPDGSVWPCHTLGHKVGNIKERKFSEIWNSKPYRDYRNLVKKSLWHICAKCTEFYRY